MPTETRSVLPHQTSDADEATEVLSDYWPTSHSHWLRGFAVYVSVCVCVCECVCVYWDAAVALKRLRWWRCVLGGLLAAPYSQACLSVSSAWPSPLHLSSL